MINLFIILQAINIKPIQVYLGSSLKDMVWVDLKMEEKEKMFLNDPKNKVAVEGHKGPHGEDYHKEIYNRLEAVGARGEEKARKEGITEESKIIEQGAKEFIKELQKLSKECSTEGERFNKIISKKI